MKKIIIIIVLMAIPAPLLAEATNPLSLLNGKVEKEKKENPCKNKPDTVFCGNKWGCISQAECNKKRNSGGGSAASLPLEDLCIWLEIKNSKGKIKKKCTKEEIKTAFKALLEAKAAAAAADGKAVTADKKAEGAKTAANEAKEAAGTSLAGFIFFGFLAAIAFAAFILAIIAHKKAHTALFGSPNGHT